MGAKPFRESYVEASEDPAAVAKLIEHFKDTINSSLPDEKEKFPHSAGCTPLTFALSEPHPSAAKIRALVAAGARLDQADLCNTYPLAVACRNPGVTSAVLESMCEQIPAPQRDCIHRREPNGHTPLQELSASVVKRDPADAAACLRVLVRYGANLHDADTAKNSVLHVANGHENHSCCDAAIFMAFAGLLEGPTLGVALQGNLADVTPLHLAAGRGCPQDVQMLLALGADPNAADMKGDTVLHYLAASTNGSEEALHACCALLRAAGALPGRKNKRHKETPLTLAGVEGHVAFIEPFYTHFHTVDGADGFDVNAVNADHDAAIHTFFDQGSYALLKLINACSANPNARGHDGNTILHLCALRDQHFTMKALLSEAKTEFDVDAENDKGKTATSLCVAGKHKTHTQMQLLLMAYQSGH